MASINDTQRLYIAISPSGEEKVILDLNTYILKTCRSIQGNSTNIECKLRNDFGDDIGIKRN